ncbi:uncharacterized protein LOC118780278 [Megalops cyprinoides]|uniref:uncharacterized protein LOC118780278 n=1 Tax=Megalops cyprinoides TaxID=118141 RepID=UPI001864F147|nr:uncharacterized protein LOC118780278 [Megalops cyprinoides]
MKCFPCAVCDPGLNLKIYEECTSTSNTVCSPLDQHFCTERDEKGSCRKAERHRICEPGQIVKQTGTASTDTICEDCGNKTFSDGLSTYCKPHRDCRSEGLVEVQPGNRFSDSECGQQSMTGLIVGISVSLGIVLLIAAGVILFILGKRRGQKMAQSYTVNKGTPKLQQVSSTLKEQSEPLVRISAAVDGVRISAAVDGVRISAEVDGVRISAVVDGVRISAGVNGVKISGVDGVRISAGVDGVRISAGVNGVQISGVDGVWISAGVDGVRISGVDGHLHCKGTILTINTLLLLCDVAYACGRAEYKIGEECCPMCSPGSHVYKHCTEYTSTSCVPCVGETFIDEPNGLSQCFRCAVCDQGLGLKTYKACTPTSDTVCGPLDQHYCIDQDKKGCRAAQRHTNCKPGQFIKQNGTSSTDTICGNCLGNTYSDGFFTSCKPHTDCKSKGLYEVKPGNPSADAECGGKFLDGPIVGAVFGIVTLIIAGGVLLFFIKRRRKQRQGTQQSTEMNGVQQQDTDSPFLGNGAEPATDPT